MFALGIENGDILNLSFLLHFFVETFLEKLSLSSNFVEEVQDKHLFLSIFFNQFLKQGVASLACFKYDKLVVVLISL